MTDLGDVPCGAVWLEIIFGNPFSRFSKQTDSMKQIITLYRLITPNTLFLLNKVNLIQEKI